IDEKTLGLHQEARAPGQKEKNQHQRRRQPESGFRRQEDGHHVLDDQVGQPSRKVANFPDTKHTHQPRPSRHGLGMGVSVAGSLYLPADLLSRQSVLLRKYLRDTYEFLRGLLYR